MLGKLRIIGDHLYIARTVFQCTIIFPRDIRSFDELTSTEQFSNHALSIVSTIQCPVHQSLIVDMNCNDIIPFLQPRLNIKTIIKIMKMVTWRRTLTDKLSINIELVVIVCSNINMSWSRCVIDMKYFANE